MNWTTVFDVIAAICLLAGALLTFIAGLGLVRLPDLLSRMHAATKPQVLGLCLVLTGLGFRLRDLEVVALLVLVGLFQLITSPVANHMVARAAVRAGQIDRDRLIVDELTPVLENFDEPRGAP
ncbi:monovalent cation/H(+) antiporter subunit G [Nocardioides alcanivorans]|uniref:monovalent cation/H(+) antiporter subunit G n=1 Tax=Nocardioides alcanivorans TaxID=2897352 RepID=UPI001F169B78|nr:monovalent cation/H(+) antiporter subunit G [Nocardioides alcanivorans]